MLQKLVLNNLTCKKLEKTGLNCRNQMHKKQRNSFFFFPRQKSFFGASTRNLVKTQQSVHNVPTLMHIALFSLVDWPLQSCWKFLICISSHKYSHWVIWIKFLPNWNCWSIYLSPDQDISALNLQLKRY